SNFMPSARAVCRTTPDSHLEAYDRTSITSEDELQPELDLAPNGLRIAKLAEAGRVYRKRRAVGRRQEKRRRVGQIEKLRPELERGAIREAGVLEDREVSIDRSRTAGHVTCRVAEEPDRHARRAQHRAWDSERRRIEILIHALVCVHVDAADAVGYVKGGECLRHERHAHVSGEATANGRDSVHLPAADDFPRQAAPAQKGFAFAERQLVGVAGNEALRDIERGGTVIAAAVERVERQ